MPIPIPYSAPRRPVVTPNGTASSDITSVTNGNAILRWSSTASGTTLTPLWDSSSMCWRSSGTVISSATGTPVPK